MDFLHGVPRSISSVGIVALLTVFSTNQFWNIHTFCAFAAEPTAVLLFALVLFAIGSDYFVILFVCVGCFWLAV